MRSQPLIACLLSFLMAGSVTGQAGCTWSGLGSGLSGPVLSMAVFDDGSGPAVFVGGMFTLAGGSIVRSIAKWDGTSWSGLAGGMSPSGFSAARVEALAVFDDGSGPALYAGGRFSAAGGVPATNLARWDGSSWTAIGNVPLGVFALATYDDGHGEDLYVGSSSLHRWDGTSLSLAASTSGPFGSSVLALQVFDEGNGSSLYVGGSFTNIGSVAASNVACWTGAAWSALGSGLTVAPNSNPQVETFAVFDAGQGPHLYAGGIFNFPTRGVARWTGSSWAPLGSGIAPGIFFEPECTTLHVFDDGNGPALYAGGPFFSVGGISALGIARWDGTSWSSLGPGMSGSSPRVSAAAVLTDGSQARLFVGGGFGGAPGTAAANIAQLSCGSTVSLDASQPGGPGTPLRLSNVNLTAGLNYRNIFSFDLCPVPGQGPLLGLCATTPADLQVLVNLLASPPGTLFNFHAAHDTTFWPPLLVPPVTVDGICFEFTNGVIGEVSAVRRLQIL